MKKLLQIPIAMLVLTACATSSWVTRQYQPYKGGVVKYLNAGADSIIEGRREDAMAKMNKFCGGSGYELLKESNDSNWTAYSAQTNSLTQTTTVTPVSSSYLHLYFKCR